MPPKSDALLITIEFLLVAYILTDMSVSIFTGSNNTVTPQEIVIGSNSTIEDPKIVLLGCFAVDEHNRLTKSNLKFQSVVKALSAQSSYMLLIQVNDDGAFSKSKLYGAIVNAQEKNRMTLVAFEEYMEYES